MKYVEISETSKKLNLWVLILSIVGLVYLFKNFVVGIIIISFSIFLFLIGMAHAYKKVYNGEIYWERDSKLYNGKIIECPYCSTENPETSDYCYKCNKKIR